MGDFENIKWGDKLDLNNANYNDDCEIVPMFNSSSGNYPESVVLNLLPNQAWAAELQTYVIQSNVLYISKQIKIK